MQDEKPASEAPSGSASGSAPESPAEGPGGQEGSARPLEENVKSRSTWLRLFFMLVISLLYGVSRVVLGAVVVIQFFWVLFTAETNENLKRFGQQLATYTFQIVRYLTFNTEERPFPFDLDWPTE